MYRDAPNAHLLLSHPLLLRLLLLYPPLLLLLLSHMSLPLLRLLLLCSSVYASSSPICLVELGLLLTAGQIHTRTQSTCITRRQETMPPDLLPLAPRCTVVHDEDSTIIAAWSMRFASGSVLLLALDLATPPDGSSPGHDFAATLAPSRL